MNQFLKLDKDQFAKDTNLVSIRRGDDIELKGIIFNKNCDGESSLDATGMSATAFFKGEEMDLSYDVEFTSESRGEFKVNIPASGSEIMAVTEPGLGIGFYIVVSDSGLLSTVESEGGVLEVLDRNFQEQ